MRGLREPSLGEFPPTRVLKDQAIFCISSIDWDFIWQEHQEIMTTLASQGNRVLFMENTGVRAAHVRDLPRLAHRIRNWWRGTKGFWEERENLVVYSPIILPFPYSRVARWINRTLLLRALRRWMRATGFGQPILWSFLPTPLVSDLADHLDPKLVVYSCLADFEELNSHAGKVTKSEQQLLARADLVFAQGEILRQRCQPHPRVHVFPPGVSLERFTSEGQPAPELKDVQRPVIGYVGGLHRHIDFDLLVRVAKECQGTLVLIGPVQTDVSLLKSCSNVLFVDQQPHTRIPEFIQAFDVGLIPYLLSPYTTTVYPTKMNEYLALGVPVVATALPEVERYNAMHGEVVRVAKDSEAFIAAIRDVTGSTDSKRERDRRVEVARCNSWESRIRQMEGLITQRLYERRAEGERWEVRLRRMYRVTRQRMLWSAAALAMLYVALFQSPCVWWLASPLRVSQSPQPADAIVVFAGGVGESGKAGGGYQERVQKAVELYREGYAKVMIFSSGYRFAFREAELMRDLAVEQGVPRTAIVLEMNAANTRENVTFACGIFRQHHWTRILLVSSPYHMRRVLWTFRKQAPEIAVVATPVSFSQFYSHESHEAASLEQIRGILHEYAAIVAYWWRGWL